MTQWVSDNTVLLILALPYAYLLAWVITTAYFHVKYDYHKRFLKNIGRE
jgi:hypothetical protein